MVRTSRRSTVLIGVYACAVALAVAVATLATFAISALIHEYVFDIAVMRIQGYQTEFFLVQGLAVAATLGVKPRGWRVVPWIAGTLGFNLASSVLFFASIFSALVGSGASAGTRWGLLVLVSVETFLWFAVVAAVFSLPAVRRGYLRVRRWIDGAAGAVFVAFGLTLVFDRRLT